MKKVTIQDVAKELNLSRNTVAKALNNSDTVAYETRYVVIKKAYEMGYSKLSPIMLTEFQIKDRVDKVKTIVVLARRELSTFWNRIIMGISDELNKNNCKLQFNFISDEDEQNGILPLDMQSEVSGIIMLSVFSDKYVNLIVKNEVPIVFLDASQDSSKFTQWGDVVLFEGFNSVKKITEHMIERGARKFSFIGDITYCKTILERYNGFCFALTMAGIPVDEEMMMIEHVPTRYYKKYEVEEAISRLPYVPDAIVCANDDIAKDVLVCLRERNLKVPQDVMVSGFDNKEEAALLVPALTTAHIGNQRMGRRLVQQLMWRIENMDMPHEIITINTEVMLRESTERE